MLARACGAIFGAGLLWFNARMTPIRTNIVGPSVSATKISASTAAIHAGWCCSVSGSFVMMSPPHPWASEAASPRDRNRIIEGTGPTHAAAAWTGLAQRVFDVDAATGPIVPLA